MNVPESPSPTNDARERIYRSPLHMIIVNNDNFRFAASQIIYAAAAGESSVGNGMGPVN